MSDETMTARNVAETMRDVMAEMPGVALLRPGSGDDERPPLVPLLLADVPAGRRVEDLTAKVEAALTRMAPLRRKGVARMRDLSSLIEWSRRFRGEGSALFASGDREKPALTCVANWHAEGAPSSSPFDRDEGAGHGDHRAVYEFPLSPEWQAWMGVAGKALDKGALGDFLDERIADVLQPPPALLTGADPDAGEERLIRIAQMLEARWGTPARLMEMARAFQVHETSNLTLTANRDTGEGTIQFVNEHRDAEGKPLQIPSLFLIAIPVFEGGPAYRIPVRFRYRKAGANVVFVLQPHDPRAAFDDAYGEACAAAAEQTALPLFTGAPEA